MVQRAVIYAQTGSPSQVLSVITHPDPPPPTSGTVNIRFILSPINPSDLNVIEGVYPSQPSPDNSLGTGGPVFVAGGEGLAEITDVPADSPLKKGDWVVMALNRPIGSWSSARNVTLDDVLKIPNPKGLSTVNGATIMVNPTTAYIMLTEFIKLEAGEWIVQNGANSAVGQAVIQIAAARGLKTINFVRTRDNFDALKASMEAIGATKVFTYDDLENKSFRNTIKESTGGANIRLGLNCVGGQETARMAQLLGDSAHLITYGAMSKQPLSLSNSLFIFKNLTSHGYWQKRWNDEKGIPERQRVMQALVDLMVQGKLKEPEHEIITIGSDESDEDAGRRITQVIDQLLQGRYAKKVLLQFD